MGRWLIAIGLVLVIAGALTMLGERAGIRLGRLPGDIVVRGRRGSFYFPIVTCLLVSAVLSAVAWFFSRR